MDVTGTVAELEGRLAGYPPERYPVQHATTCFHLGVALTDEGRPGEALRVLETAASLFQARLAPEYAKTRNAIGVALRVAGRLGEAADVFRHAAMLFADAHLPLEQGAAEFNLGLVLRDLRDTDAAQRCFEDARGHLDPDREPRMAAAAARELGATLLAAGAYAQARDVLRSAVDLAEHAGDPAGLGAAANVLGLAQLASDDVTGAIEAFRTAAAAHPRSVRPGEYAMAKANLAVTYERTGDLARARLAAAQALGVPGAEAPVREQAEGVAARLGLRPGALLPVLDDEPPDRWPPPVREELARWTDADAGVRHAESGAWVDGELARPGVGVELAEAWLGGLVELPPEAMAAVIRSTLEALAERDHDEAARFRTEVSRAMARLHVPQWERLRDVFARIAADLGQEASWG